MQNLIKVRKCKFIKTITCAKNEKQIIEHYTNSWHIEVSFRISKHT